MTDDSVNALILEARVMASDCYPATAKLLTRLADALERLPALEQTYEPFAGLAVCDDPNCGCCSQIRDARTAWRAPEGGP